MRSVLTLALLALAALLSGCGTLQRSPLTTEQSLETLERRAAAVTTLSLLSLEDNPEARADVAAIVVDVSEAVRGAAADEPTLAETGRLVDRELAGISGRKGVIARAVWQALAGEIEMHILTYLERASDEPDLASLGQLIHAAATGAVQGARRFARAS